MYKATPAEGVMGAFVGLLDAMVADSLTRVLKTTGVGGNGQGLFNRKDAADYLDVSGPTILKLLKAGEIKAITIPGTSAMRYTKRSLDNFIERQSKGKVSHGIHCQAPEPAVLDSIQGPHRPPPDRKAR